MPAIDNATLAVLMNAEAIAVNQDAWYVVGLLKLIAMGLREKDWPLRERRRRAPDRVMSPE